VTLVVSPLIALMKDQVDQLTASGVSATFLNSTLEPQENRRLRELRTALPEVPVIALTATPRVREDILGQLALRDPAVFVASFNRPNLNYLVEPKQDAVARIVEFVGGRGQDSGIVYAQSRKRSEELAACLRNAGISAVCYHAGLEATERARNQEAFLRDEVRVVCATVAFGMGINKPDLRFVIHADLPKNLEGYYQETGRAGRDGLPADCLLLFSRGDVTKVLRFIDEIPDGEARDHARFQLDRMADFAESDACRRVERATSPKRSPTVSPSIPGASTPPMRKPKFAPPSTATPRIRSSPSTSTSAAASATGSSDSTARLKPGQAWRQAESLLLIGPLQTCSGWRFR
jgi:superfamily II DNA helicase RecQ